LFVVCGLNVDLIHLLCASKDVAGSRGRALDRGVRGSPLKLKHF